MRKNPPENPRQFSNQNLGVSGPKSTLQGSGLEMLGIRQNRNVNRMKTKVSNQFGMNLGDPFLGAPHQGPNYYCNDMNDFVHRAVPSAGCLVTERAIS